VELLVRQYTEDMKDIEKMKLDKFNSEMDMKVKTLKFSKKIKIKASDIDSDFSALANIDY
jgi:hypothetical protein